MSTKTCVTGNNLVLHKALTTVQFYHMTGGWPHSLWAISLAEHKRRVLQMDLPGVPVADTDVIHSSTSWWAWMVISFNTYICCKDLITHMWKQLFSNHTTRLPPNTISLNAFKIISNFLVIKSTATVRTDVNVHRTFCQSCRGTRTL